MIRAATLAIVFLSGVAACSNGDTATSDPVPTSVSASVEPAERILALGEEPVLADLLALGVRPIASSANVVIDGRFVGLGDLDSDGIEALVSTEPNLEQLASIDADVVVATEFVVDRLGRNVLEGLGRLVVIPDGDPEVQVRALADAFDRHAEADDLLAELDDAVAEGRSALGDANLAVSVATVYPGPTVAAWVDGPVDIPDTLLAMGVTLRPGSGDVAGAEGGRVFLSEEQLGLLDADAIVALQSDHVDGEAEAVRDIAQDPLWSRLPAVAANRVITIDRLGYFGIAGRIRLVGDLVEALGSL